MMTGAKAVGAGVAVLAICGVPSPAVGEDVYTIPFHVSDCASCMLAAGTGDMDSSIDTSWGQTTRLRGGSTTLTVPRWVESLQIEISKRKGKKVFSAGNAASLLVFQYWGEPEGLPISPRRARTSDAGYICVAPRDGLSISARSKLIRAPKYQGWKKDPLFEKWMVMFWASPTISGLPAFYDEGPMSAVRGVVGVQNTVCGAEYR
jgi:hypothetical protein